MGLVKRECSGVGKNGHGYPGDDRRVEFEAVKRNVQ